MHTSEHEYGEMPGGQSVLFVVNVAGIAVGDGCVGDSEDVWKLRLAEELVTVEIK